jgi:hypothetical protein
MGKMEKKGEVAFFLDFTVRPERWGTDIKAGPVPFSTQPPLAWEFVPKIEEHWLKVEWDYLPVLLGGRVKCDVSGSPR